jgi:hypothetical protein
MKAKLKHYKNIKREREREREQEQDLDLNNQAPKCLFYRPKFETIDLMTNC